MLTRIVLEDLRRCAEFLRRDSEKLSGKTVLISGAAGFMGSYFSDLIAYFNDNGFLEKQCKLIAIDNLISGRKSRIEHLMKKDYFKFVQADICKPLKVGSSVDFIIHAASIASPTIFRQHPFETIDSNVVGTTNLLQLAREKGVESFVFTSTSEVYGDPDAQHIPTPETYRGNVSCTGPRACYDESKRLGETICINFYDQFNVPVKITRSFNVYGARLELNDKRVLADFMKNAWEGHDVILLSDGSPTRSFCYITDSVRGHFKVLLSKANGEAFNIGNDSEEMSILELAKRIIKVSGKDLKVEFKTSEDKYYLTDNPSRRCPDISKMRSFFKDWKPKVSLDEGLKRTWDYYLEAKE